MGVLKERHRAIGLMEGVNRLNSKLRIPLAARHEALKRKLSSLNTQFREEMKRPLPEWLKLRALKANWLTAKDRIIFLLSGNRPRQGEGQGQGGESQMFNGLGISIAIILLGMFGLPIILLPFW